LAVPTLSLNCVFYYTRIKMTVKSRHDHDGLTYILLNDKNTHAAQMF